MSIEEQFKQIESLEDNWDGEGSLQPSSENIQKARALLEGFSGEIYIGPGPEGSVDVYYISKNKFRAFLVNINDEGSNYYADITSSKEDWVEQGDLENKEHFLEVYNKVYAS